jgi:heme/copper-type cytochrome/quinol oxidase subunit 4
MRLTSTVAQITISQIFHVKSGDVSSKTRAATISRMAAAQMLFLLVCRMLHKSGDRDSDLQEAESKHDHDTGLLQHRKL